jgi:hypothetical protein
MREYRTFSKLYATAFALVIIWYKNILARMEMCTVLIMVPHSLHEQGGRTGKLILCVESKITDGGSVRGSGSVASDICWEIYYRLNGFLHY